MFIPIGDENPTERRPYVNYALIGANIVAFLLFCLPDPFARGFIQWAMVPAQLEWPTLFTSLFLHAGWMHLIGNMVFLWIFGDNIEDRLGHVGYACFYLASGLAADGAHIASDPNSTLPTLGASGAISGVLGAYLVFYPRHHVKTFVWIGWFFADVIRVPAFIWIGLWFGQQILLKFLEQGQGGVAYLAHIGGFVAGVAIAGAARAVLSSRWPSASIPAGLRESSRGSSARRPFITVQEDAGIEYLDEPQDVWSVLRLSDDLYSVGRIAEAASAITGEPARDISRRLENTRGVIVREVERIPAEKIQRELHTLGIPSAIILHNRSNFPPAPARVDSVSWDDRVLRLRVGDQIVNLPWTAPFLYVGARHGRVPFIDVFVNRRSAFRIAPLPGVALTEVDPVSRRESSADFSALARAVVDHRQSAALNEGVRVAAHHGDWGWLDFRSPADYDDYLFWLYNLILSQVPIHRE